MRLVIVVLVSVLMACAEIQPRGFRGPNGKTAYSMRCSGMGRTLDACYQKAGELCPAGYNIIDRASGTVVIPFNGGIMAAPQHNLAVECK
jgi:hypothetical protein